MPAPEKMVFKPFLMSRDDFFPDLREVYRAAREAEYYQPEHVTGLRSTTVYHPKGIKKKLERTLGLRITRWDTDPLEENGVFYQGLSHGARRETPGVHSDFPLNDVTVLIYLTPGLPLDCGTSLWRHKATGLCTQPTAADARRLGIPRETLRLTLERDFRRRERWEEIHRVGYAANRMAAYPSGLLHSATRHYGGSLADGRLYITYRIGVDWASLAA